MVGHLPPMDIFKCQSYEIRLKYFLVNNSKEKLNKISLRVEFNPNIKVSVNCEVCFGIVSDITAGPVRPAPAACRG